uniref:glycosyltransferase family 2 protein n=1 Tax=uncultured Sphingomonas sp. TaxID=158754 RepID=UPI0035CA8069
MIEPKDTDCLTWIGGEVRTLPTAAVYGLSVVRNEIDRLPYLLDYYRSIGVEQFLFVSDHSSDGTTEYLLEQSDCAVFLPDTSFKDSRCGVDWQALLLDLYCCDAWVITFDADEIFTYPHAETLNLPGLCRFLDKEGANAVGSFLLDMYSDGPVRSAIYQAPAPFLSTSPLFDKDYRFLPAAEPKDYVPSGKVIGGPRARLFYPFQNRYSVFSRAAMYALVNVLQKYGILREGRVHYVPTLLKAPLVKWIAGSYRTGNHNIRNGPGVKLSQITSAILHFKFFSDFHERALREISRGQHYNGAQEYKRYVAFTEANPDFNFSYPGSQRYTGSADLVRLGLITSSAALDAFAAGAVPSPR